jgi:transcription initiation factor TFIIB
LDPTILFRSAQNEELLRGRSIEAIAAASVYGACRCNGRSQLLDDIVIVPKVGESRVTNAYKTLNEELGLPAKPATPTMYIPRLASDLDCPDRIRRRARTLAEAAEDAGVTMGVHPAGFAAACLYTAGQEAGRWVTQAAAADVANVTTTTIRKHRDGLQQFATVQRRDRVTQATRENPLQSSR